ncbi:hypothetical protein EVAR_64248_1 [Eumeta japonica]|uniref:Uncharacterized protein n=1 Tax=Eumeta variegata TaxID=151549 RepID=A0A4C1YYU7_EUMVA|nr:hypothetical protein EVAR_64248_1 [Eumeta japonica]
MNDRRVVENVRSDRAQPDFVGDLLKPLGLLAGQFKQDFERTSFTDIVVAISDRDRQYLSRTELAGTAEVPKRPTENRNIMEGLRLGVTYEKGVTLGNVTMSHRTRERPAECLASLSHSTMIGLPARSTRISA